MIILTRPRRPALWVRLLRIVAIAGSAVGLAIGAEVLRRKLKIGAPRISVIRNGRTTRMRVSVGRRGKRAVVSASRS